ncbi:hypothetical protein [Paenibacillus eucommiae]|uniref:Uncharacterized protein n=1 Tax=Paenibacillus eucommiae TaxID=1355755 RepID=A0ABS4IV10_9BACL|nr:hypothetical protein [Paenibacillus eucommiae]MBP1991415.1 hypothetical protein [Paenibacillus eucommiae]
MHSMHSIYPAHLHLPHIKLHSLALMTIISKAITRAIMMSMADGSTQGIRVSGTKDTKGRDIKASGTKDTMDNNMFFTNMAFILYIIPTGLTRGIIHITHIPFPTPASSILGIIPISSSVSLLFLPSITDNKAEQLIQTS